MTDTAPGRDAIDARLELLCPGVEPKHFGTLRKVRARRPRSARRRQLLPRRRAGSGPISLDSPTAVTALAFTEDPRLGPIGTPHGRLQFLQVVGLTGDEYEAAKRWDTAGLLALLADGNPLLVTDLGRPSITDDPAWAAAIEAGRARDGSSTGQLNVVGLTATRHGDAVRLTVPATSTETFTQAVRDRLPHGRHLRLDGDDAILVLLPAGTFAIREPAEGVLELDLPPEALAAIPATPAEGPLTVEFRE